MMPPQIVAIAKNILHESAAISADPKIRVGRTETEKLIRVVALFLSMEDEKLRNAILAEAQNRIFVAQAIGKKPWEI